MSESEPEIPEGKIEIIEPGLLGNPWIWTGIPVALFLLAWMLFGIAWWLDTP